MGNLCQSYWCSDPGHSCLRTEPFRFQQPCLILWSQRVIRICAEVKSDSHNGNLGKQLSLLQGKAIFIPGQNSFLLTLHRDNKNLWKAKLSWISLKSYHSSRRSPFLFGFLLSSHLFPETAVWWIKYFSSYNSLTTQLNSLATCICPMPPSSSGIPLLLSKPMLWPWKSTGCCLLLLL